MNKIRFEEGYKTGYAGLFGGWQDLTVVSRTDETVTFRTEWTAEDTGEACYADATYDIELDCCYGTLIERVAVWEYSGAIGYVYAADEDTIDRLQEGYEPTGATYEITYDEPEFTDDGHMVLHPVRETFNGTWDALQAYLDELRMGDFYHIDAALIDGEPEYEDELEPDDDEPCVPLFTVQIVSPGGVRRDLYGCLTEREATDFCEQQNWVWLDENCFEWSLDIVGESCCDDDYIPSATAGDYSPSAPWNAPGMSVRDFL